MKIIGRGRSVYDEVGDLINILYSLRGDAWKHQEGNKAAGSRVRKGLQNVKTQCQDIRVQVLAEQKSGNPLGQRNSEPWKKGGG